MQPQSTTRHSTQYYSWWNYIDLVENGCWNWQASTNGRYGVLWNPKTRRMIYAHRHVYESCIGPIPKGLVVDHLCRNPLCVNPAHIEPVTQRENLHRGVDVGHGHETHCPQGHPYDEANTFRYRTGRYCRACGNARRRERYWRAKGKSIL